MQGRGEGRALGWMVAVFAVLVWLPVSHERLVVALREALALAQWYAREHVLLCLVPAFLIAGAMGVFVSQAAVMRYLGARARPWIAYPVAAVSGTVLAVCSCTILPLFAGIYRLGAGLGPACAFLYSGPAINVLAIVLTATVLGPRLGLARAVGAIAFSVVIGLAMHGLFRREAEVRAAAAPPPATAPVRSLAQQALFFGLMVIVLVAANWGRPQAATGLWHAIWASKWWLTAAAAVGLGALLWRWFAVPLWQLGLIALAVAVAVLLRSGRPEVPFTIGVAGLAWALASRPGELREWGGQSWGFAKQILPLLLLGVLVAGALLGRPGQEGLIPSTWISSAVGGNSLRANFVAAFAGAFMYFATLTEVPIVQGLVGSGMGQGPALALLLAGPALSLPSMLVIRGVLGTAKTAVFILLTIAMATLCGWGYGLWCG